MPWNLSSTGTSTEAPTRPPLNSQQSNSLPSTPYQHARNLSFHSRSPSPPHGSTSPRSTHSESTHLPPAFRKPFTHCKYETAMAFFRRRMPYTLGTDVLPDEKEGLKEQLDADEERKLTTDMLEVYDRLLPSAESDDRRRQLVRKLERLFNDQWPGHDIKVHVFGSSGNKLCSSDSDDGMERVVCVSHAKVPIVKIWDPELRLACDMNVNNTLALENTRMVRTYVEIDERVRPLAMIIKYWTKRRILCDAGLGGTLSSYTWICLIINFLQTRDPPILPSLQARPHKKRLSPEGFVCSFDDDMNSLSGYGRKNKQTLGELLFQFFRYYGHELNYEKYVVSVREGGLISKEDKGWHLLQNNRLCVEEPFNTSRNLGNTADDTSFRGVHMELRRAFKAVAEGSLDHCCEQYEYPPEEERSWERPPPQPRPIITAAPSHSTRGARGGGRGGRHSNQYTRGGHSGGRRSSNTPNKANNYRQPHNNGFPMPQQQETTADDTSRSRSGTVNHPPLNASMRQPTYYASPYLPVSLTGVQGSSTNPPSPSATAASPDLRRNPRRSSVANGSPGGSLRAHSQPARTVHSLPSYAPIYTATQSMETPQMSKHRNTPGSPDRTHGEDESPFMPSSVPNVSNSTYFDESRSTEYIGYYLATSPQLQAYHQNAMSTPLSAPVGLALQNGGIVPFVANPQDYMSTVPPHEAGLWRETDTTSGLKMGSSHQRTTPRSTASGDRSGPLIVDGSVPLSEHRPPVAAEGYDPYVAMSHCASNSDDHTTDTPASVSDSFSQDFQDSSSVEVDQPPYFGRQGIDMHTPATAAESLANGHAGKQSLLSSRLQNLHLSNNDKVAEPTPKSAAEKAKVPHTHQEKQTGGPEKSSTTSVLSPVAESHVPSSNGKRRQNGLDTSDKTNGASHKPRSKARTDTSHNSSTTSGDTKERHSGHHGHHGHHGRKMNGVHPAQDSHHTNSGWQTTKKKQKKGAKSNTEHRHGLHNGAEPLPADESLRKGG
ncbi:conserved hypothetical protein [Aspergillus terreus NIH2624]|uniref:polynucleotide adenylyltransferase n=1 Tax=Aspergillus terreus (strain NIH 2624 / FGSC A1156) TaxID=341663 RepID=Q0CD84_ASPTN|nr:uncharacterized protein ATEG_08350 [Aspergillus terreus NIH2624]EAU31523.1 conserved hypothetical protein [Aspergillus terreus NIH2624]